ncbi:MAG: hypothetical protein JWO30_4131 [Fibrobacteres bacterium]|nr:hypothetical protein [Fibrobacterota bacterium]
MNTRNFRPWFYLFACLCLVLSSCSQEDGGTTITQVVDPSAKASITFSVLDASTRQPLKGAEIVFIGGPTVISREDGTISVDSIGIGSHLVRTGLQGYETAEDEVQLSVYGVETVKPQATLKTILLHKQGVSVSGKILIGPKSGKGALQVGNGVTVELRLNGNFVDAFRTAQSSESGEFRFTGLPENVECSLSVQSLVKDGDTYGVSDQPRTPADLAVGVDYRLPTSILRFFPKGGLLVLSPSEIKLQLGKPLEILFSNSIDTADLPTDAVTLLSNNVSVAIRYSWKDGNTILSLMPFQGDWPSLGALSIYLSGLKDTDGNLLQGPVNGKVAIDLTTEAPAGGLRPVDSIWVKSVYFSDPFFAVDTDVVDYSTPHYTLTWNKVEGAGEYEVYTRETPDALWLLSGTAFRDTTFEYSSPDDGRVYKPMTRQHMVVAMTQGGRGDISKAPVLSLKDGLGPTVGYGSTLAKVNQNESFDNTSGTEPKTVLLKMTLRNQAGNALEPLDVSRGPAFKVVEGGYIGGYYYGNYNYKPGIAKFTWTAGNTALIEVTIDPGKDGRGDTITLDLNGIQDLAGNPLMGMLGIQGLTQLSFQTN